MKKILEQCMAEKKIITAYPSFYDLNNFSMGYVYSIDGDIVTLKVVSFDGLYLGYRILTISDIVMIDTNSRLSQKIELLLNNFKGRYNQVFVHKDTIMELLLYSKDEKIILNIYLSPNQVDRVICIVKDINHGIATVELVDDYGSCFQVASIVIISIKSIEYGSKELQILQFLNQNLK